MRRRRRQYRRSRRYSDAPLNHERWFVSYADFVTLLFAVFVVLFSSANSDRRRASIGHAVGEAFRELAIFAPSSKVMPLQEGDSRADAPGFINLNSAALASEHSDGAAEQARQNNLRNLKVQLESLLHTELEKNLLTVSQDARGIIVSLGEAGFFDSGSAFMKPAGLPALRRIAEKFRQIPENLRIEGHTDNTPIHTPEFPSNWELSAARATNVLQYFIGTAQIPPERLSAAGYGEYHPKASNNTADGRMLNRRVDLVILAAEKP